MTRTLILMMFLATSATYLSGQRYSVRSNYDNTYSELDYKGVEKYLTSYERRKVYRLKTDLRRYRYTASLDRHINKREARHIRNLQNQISYVYRPYLSRYNNTGYRTSSRRNRRCRY